MAWTEEKKEIVRKLWAGGWSATQIADELGDVSRNAVLGFIYRQGLQRDPTSRRQTQHYTRMAARRPSKTATPTLVLVQPEATAVTLLGLTNWTCRFPLGAEEEPAVLYCGAAADASLHPYCAFHQGIARLTPKSRTVAVPTEKRAA